MGYILKSDGTILKKKKEEDKNKVLTIKPFTYSDNGSGNNFIKEDSFERKKTNNSWLDAGALSDGYQFGDISKTILGTGANVASGVLKGVSDVGFGTGKLVAGGVAQAADLIGQDEWANKVRNRIAGKDEETNKRLKAADIFGNINEATQDASVLGKTGNEIVKSIGQIAGYGAASAVNPVLGSAAMFGSSAGGALGEAYSKENVTNEQAWTKALVGGGISLATERLFGLFGKSGLDTAVANKISSKLTSGMSKELARLGVQATSEATEELLEYAGNQLLDLGIDAASNGKGAKFHKDWNWEEVGQQMAIAAVASGIVGAGTKAIGIRNTQGSNLQEKINNYALQEDIQEGVLPPQESPLEKLQRTNIEQRQQINQQVEQELATRRKGINQELSLPTVSTEGMNLMESASRYNIKPETQSTVQNLMENRGIESRWDATRFNDNSVNALWTKDANGNRQVIFNPNASLDTIVEEVAVHELTHDILSSKNTTLNSQEVLNYVKTLQGYNEARQSLENTYSTMYDPNSAEFNSLIDEEVVADVLGRKLGNQEFINRLVNSKPSVAKSIYNWVVSKLNSIINNGKVRSEKLYWQNIKNNFENAYKQEYKNNEMASTKYSIEQNYRGSHQIENAKPITELNVDDITTKIKDIDGYLTNQSESDLKKLKKILNNPNEKVTIYRASPVNELNSGDWVTTDKSYAKNVANNNGGKVYSYEVNANELYYPDNVNDLPSLHRLSSFQYNENTQNNVKYSISNVDNQGRELSKQQQEYFKDSKARDENGKLVTVYHGTTEEINVFDKNRLGKNTGAASAGEGFFFTDNKKIAEDYSRYARPQYIKDLENEYKRLEKIAQKTGNWDDYYRAYEKYEEAELTYAYNEDDQRTNAENQKEVYLNLTNPLIHDFKGMEYRDESYYDLLKQAKENGNDGAIFKNTYDGYGEKGSWENPMTNIYVAFESNQIKNVDNTTPTTNDDIRYSKQSEEWDKWNNKTITPEGTKTKLGDIKLPTRQKTSLPTKSTTETKKTVEKPKNVSIPMVKNNESLRVESQRIANEINKNETFKQKGWLKTATNSDVLKDSGLIKDLDPNQLNYVVQSNKSSVDKANNTINTLGYEKSLDKVKQIINDDKLPSASDVALMQRMIQEAAKRGDAATVQDLIMDTAIVGTDLGQATQALSIIQRLTPEGQLKLYTKLVQRAKVRGEKSFQNVEITPEMVENVLGAYNSDGTYDQDDLNARVEQFKQDLANQMKSTVGDKTNAWRYLAMLGNPKTHIRNIVSNLAMNGTIKVKNAMARTLETILPVEERTKTWKPASQDVKEFAKQTTANMKDIITGEAKYNEKSAIESKKQIFKNKALEKLSNFNGNALEAEDWFFSSRAFQSTLQEYLTANGINTYEDIQNNPEIVEKAKNYAKDQAEIATFRQYSKLAATINQIEKKNKGAKLAVQALMPFKKTPINVAKAGVKYSPLGLIKSMSYDAYQLKQGNINASQFIDNLSQGLTGTSLTLLGYALAKAGILSGSGGDDKDDKYDSQLGNTGYSLNIGGNSYSISWLSPVAMPLLVGSNAYEQLEENKDWDMNVVSDTLAKTLDPLNEMSFMQGLTNALQSYGSGVDKVKGALESTAQNYVGQFFPTIFSQLASTLDDKKRSTKASNDSKYKFGEQTVRSIMYKIPGLRQKLEVATDIWGNEKEQSDNIIERAFESFIAPYSKTKQIETDLDKEIKRVYNETGETGVIPSIPYAYVKYKDETYRMSANEYTDYKKTYGQTAYNTLNKLINSNDYKQATDEDKVKMLEDVYKYARGKANQEYFDSNNIDYENDLLDKLDTLNDRYGISANTYFANKKEYDYAYQYPEKYTTIKQIAPYDKYNKYKDEITNIRNNTTNDKVETIKYINSLNMNVPQKAMFIKQYYKSFTQYDKQIAEYIAKQNLTKKEKETILKQLGFTIKDGRVYY